MTFSSTPPTKHRDPQTLASLISRLLDLYGLRERNAHHTKRIVEKNRVQVQRGRYRGTVPDGGDKDARPRSTCDSAD